MALEPDAGTSTLDAARAHARSQADASRGPTVTIPSTAAVELPAGVDAAAVIWDEVIPLGGYTSRHVPRDAIVRVADPEGDASVQVLVYNAGNSAERLNVADTVKVQWQAYLGEQALLLSDMGRVLMTLVADTSARHDALCGCSSAITNTSRYGDGRASGASPSGRDLLCLGAAKLGLARRDVGPNVTLFKGVRVHDDGSLHFDGDVQPNGYVELRAEMPVLVVLANTPHPLDDRATYAGTAARVTAWTAPRPADDPLRMTSPERERAFQNTDEWLRMVAP